MCLLILFLIFFLFYFIFKLYIIVLVLSVTFDTIIWKGNSMMENFILSQFIQLAH